MRCKYNKHCPDYSLLDLECWSDKESESCPRYRIFHLQDAIREIRKERECRENRTQRNIKTEVIEIGRS
jgi:hypothetical protein